ncbi:hypothetical protein LZ640_24425 [Aeromonas media]|uniref:hypothetical protein n=1 Tax=Aeromonas media TaxID=651 RepID=UPI001F41F78A|nr:hypothetical protein [Aeromonas media]MCE9927521.1 hypothetical protein [Aeromonas media]
MTIARSRQISLADTPYEKTENWETENWDTHLIPALTTHSPSTFLKPRDQREEPP